MGLTTPGSQLLNVVIGGALLLVGVALWFLGRWGHTNAQALSIAQGMSNDMVEHRSGVLRRGGRACQFAGALLVIAAFGLFGSIASA